jgi:hypothetical protein
VPKIAPKKGKLLFMVRPSGGFPVGLDQDDADLAWISPADWADVIEKLIFRDKNPASIRMGRISFVKSSEDPAHDSPQLSSIFWRGDNS